MSTQFPSSLSAPQSLAVDPQGLSALSSRASADPKGAVGAVARQFEALFLDNLMKTVREVHYSDDDQSSEMQTYRGMLDQQLVQSLTQGSGIGLAKMLEQQIGKMVGADPAADPTTGAAAGSAAMSRSLQAYQQAALAARGAVAGTTGIAGVGDGSGGAAEQAQGARQFVQSLLPQAGAAANQLGVDPQLVVAHAALESGWGKRIIRNQDGSNSHNLFGVKAGSDWHGATTQVATTEYVNGAAQRKVETFRSYASYQDALGDYANLLGTSPRYRSVLNQGRNIQGYAQGLQSGGYATDPRYARKLVDVMSSLAQYSA